MNRFALLLLIPLTNDSRPFPSDAVFAHDLGTLSPFDAARLHSVPGRFRIVLDSMDSEEDGLTVVECGSADGSTRTAWLYPEQELETNMPVDATLVVIHHKATVIDGVPFEGFTEYRLVDARANP